MPEFNLPLQKQPRTQAFVPRNPNKGLLVRSPDILIFNAEINTVADNKVRVHRNADRSSCQANTNSMAQLLDCIYVNQTASTDTRSTTPMVHDVKL